MNLLHKIIKYVLEALAISVAIFLTNKKVGVSELLLLTVTIMATIVVLETFSPVIMNSMKQGMGLGLGYNQVAGGEETFDSILPYDTDKYSGTPDIIMENKYKY